MTTHRIKTNDPQLVGIELTHRELEDMEEGETCAAGLMCRGLRIGNVPAFVGWYLDANEDGYDVARWAYGWRFAGHPGVYCEDCTLEIEELDREAHQS